jgi:hypothetical protein
MLPCEFFLWDNLTGHDQVNMVDSDELKCTYGMNKIDIINKGFATLHYQEKFWYFILDLI